MAESLLKTKKCKFYLACGKNEKELENIFLNSKINANCFSMSSFQINEILPIIKNADLYVGNDTGFLHISAALGIKSIGIFVTLLLIVILLILKISMLSSQKGKL